MTGPLQPALGLAAPAAAPPLDSLNTQLGQLLPSLLGMPAAGASLSAGALPSVAHAAHGSAQLAGLLQSLSGANQSLGGPALSAGTALLGGEDQGRGGAASSAQRGRPTRANSEPRPASSYNARHQQAEARRRSRINERLEALRQLVPHTERANTANFLEEVVAYVQRLQSRVVELERQLGMPPSVQLSNRPIAFSDDTPEQTLQSVQREDRRAPQSQAFLGPPAAAQQLPLAPHDPAVQAAALAVLIQQQQAQQAQQAQQLELLLQQQHQAQQAQQQAQAQQVQAQQQQIAQAQQVQAQQQQVAQAQQAQQEQAAQAQQAQQLLHLGLKMQPLPPPPMQQQHQQSSGSRLLLVATGAADSAGDQPLSTGLLALAAADSAGAPSAGEVSLPSASAPSGGGPPQEEDQAAAAAAQQRAEALRKQQEERQRDLHGIPTDEELERLHEELMAQQDSKRRRLTTS